MIPRGGAGHTEGAHPMIRTMYAEWSRLTRPRMLLPALAAGVLVAVALTAFLVCTADRQPNALGVSVGRLEESGGATVPVTLGMSFASLLVLALFVSMAAGGFSRGTWRASLLHQPRRLTLAAGNFLARCGLIALVCLAAVAVGWLTSVTLASSQGVDSSAWLSVEAMGEVGGDYLRVVVFCCGWGLLGTLLGTLTRSIPVGLGLGLLWAGPLENVLGDDLDFASAYFPGLLLRALVVPEASTIGTARLTAMLLSYAIVCVLALGLVLRRRDVTN